MATQTKTLSTKVKTASKSRKVQTINSLADLAAVSDLHIEVVQDVVNAAQDFVNAGIPFVPVPAAPIVNLPHKVAFPVKVPNKAITATLPRDGKFMYVTSNNLRRTILEGDVKHCKLVLTSDQFRSLTAAGLKQGITWDEMLRAVLAEQSFNYDPYGSAVKFIPQPDAA